MASFRVSGLGLGFRVYGFGCRVSGSGFIGLRSGVIMNMKWHTSEDPSASFFQYFGQKHRITAIPGLIRCPVQEFGGRVEPSM